jgi:hypothetical protein
MNKFKLMLALAIAVLSVVSVRAGMEVNFSIFSHNTQENPHMTTGQDCIFQIINNEVKVDTDLMGKIGEMRKTKDLAELIKSCMNQTKKAQELYNPYKETVEYASKLTASFSITNLGEVGRGLAVSNTAFNKIPYGPEPRSELRPQENRIDRELNFDQNEVTFGPELVREAFTKLVQQLSSPYDRTQMIELKKQLKEKYAAKS